MIFVCKSCLLLEHYQMSLVPSCQFYQKTSFLDSFQSSLSRFNGYQKQFFRYGSSIPFKKYKFYITQKALNDISASEQNPQRKSSFVPRKNNGDRSSFGGENPISQTSSNDEFSKRSWIKKWSETPKPNIMKKPQVVLDYRNGGDGASSDEDEKGTSLSTGNSTMEKIVEKLKRFGYVDEVSEKKKRVPERGSVEDIFYVEEGMLPNSRGGFSLDSPLGVENSLESNEEVRFPWEKPVAKEDGSVRRRSRTSLAELTLPPTEFRRLRDLSVQTKTKTKIGGAGVTQEIVDVIHEKWKTSEIVRLKCEGPPALNMKRMHEILERKTGGLVIWRSGSSVSLYRGVSYELASYQHLKKHSENFKRNDHNPSTADYNSNSWYSIGRGSDVALQTEADRIESEISKREENDGESLPKYDREINKLLDGLGPRYTDWPGPDPLPIDADMLPPVVPGYKKPFRLLPYAVKPNLGVYEATALRRVSRTIPPHFAIGRSRQHQGLAMAMIKLWEGSSIAKIALKRGVLRTTSQRMAEDIKVLTGGTLVATNKNFMVFYRGKDFLTPEVTDALLERESLTKSLQDKEEEARLRASSLFSPSIEATMESGTAGTLSESLEADARWGKRPNDKDKDKAMREAELQRHATLVRKLEFKLKRAEHKLYKAEHALAKVEAFLKPSTRQTDPDSLTDEERFMFRKMGLKMKAYLIMGRRGVFDGTVENMHLHWKYRELVKVFVNVKTFEHVRNIALTLEAESGGVLVSVDKVTKGFAVVLFRGKDYKRPTLLRPKNLLTKRKALARSIELQRHEALFKHVTAVKRGVDKIKSELDRMELVMEQGDEELYAELDSAYSSEEEDNGDENNEDESDEAYLETYISDDEEEGTDESIHNNLPSETNFPFDQDQTWESDSE